jgi:hypothetical protein
VRKRKKEKQSVTNVMFVASEDGSHGQTFAARSAVLLMTMAMLNK